jgi:hypothetical protein
MKALKRWWRMRKLLKHAPYGLAVEKKGFVDECPFFHVSRREVGGGREHGVYALYIDSCRWDKAIVIEDAMHMCNLPVEGRVYTDFGRDIMLGYYRSDLPELEIIDYGERK